MPVELAAGALPAPRPKSPQYRSMLPPGMVIEILSRVSHEPGLRSASAEQPPCFREVRCVVGARELVANGCERAYGFVRPASVT